MGTWKGPDFIDALKTRLEARPGLAGVQINSAPMGVNTAAEAITVHDLEGEQTWAALGRERKRDSFTLNCTTWIHKPGADEADAKACRDRAEALLAEVEADLKDFPETVNGSQITALNLANVSLDQGANTDGRWAQVTFSIQVTVLI